MIEYTQVHEADDLHNQPDEAKHWPLLMKVSVSRFFYVFSSFDSIACAYWACVLMFVTVSLARHFDVHVSVFLSQACKYTLMHQCVFSWSKHVGIFISDDEPRTVLQKNESEACGLVDYFDFFPPNMYLVHLRGAQILSFNYARRLLGFRTLSV